MIFQLSKKFESMISAGMDDSLYLAIENLITAHFSGFHVFLAGRGILDRLARDARFSERQRATLRAILENYSILSGKAKEVEFVTLVVPDDQPFVSEAANHTRFLKISCFELPDTWQRFRLLVEHATHDGQFFLTVCRAFARSLGYQRIGPVEIVHGGGSSIGEFYGEFCNECRPTLCIVDSDLCAPTAQLGTTAKSVKANMGREAFDTVSAEILQVRSAENFVPIEVMKEIYFSNAEIQNTLDSIARLCEYDQKESANHAIGYLGYFEFREGLKRSEIDKQKDKKSKEFLVNMWKIIDPTENEFSLSPDEEDVICPGVSANLLEQVVEYAVIPRQRERLRASCEKSPMFHSTRKIVETILCFSIAEERQRAV